MLDFDYIGTREWFFDSEGGFLRIDGQLPSLNDYVAKCRANAYKGAKFKGETEDYIRLSVRSNMRQNLAEKIPEKIKNNSLENPAENQKKIMRKIEGKINPEFFPIFLEILWVEKTRRRDVDNVKSATKYILDALKGWILDDDSPRYISQIVDKVVYDAKTAGVWVKIRKGEISWLTSEKGTLLRHGSVPSTTSSILRNG